MIFLWPIILFRKLHSSKKNRMAGFSPNLSFLEGLMAETATKVAISVAAKAKEAIVTATDEVSLYFPHLPYRPEF